jgi:hypothetical protein
LPAEAARNALYARQSLEQAESPDAPPGAGAEDIPREDRDDRFGDLEAGFRMEEKRKEVGVVIGSDQREEQLL